MAAPDTSNTNFQLAADFIQYTHQSVFLTGKAGTGKTTFLKHIKTVSNKQIAVVAPTGVAAINAGGVTIHSFFQLPFGPFLPESRDANGAGFNNKHSLLGRLRINSERRKVWQQLELLIIDEISMVRCDTLDAIDTILRSFRQRYTEPFGGVQVLLIGDMHQLPPVIPEEEWQMMQSFYQSPYFFDSKVMQQFPAAYIELDKIYRQSDEKFITLLNQVRNNRLNSEGAQLLHNCYQPDFQPLKHDGFITLTTHNKKADIINEEALRALGGKPYQYKATIEGDFNEKAYPADVVLQLKVGAQVMFIKNDVEKVRRYFNGKIGTVEKIDDEVIYVQCDGSAEPIAVAKEKWKNIRYTLNTTTQKVEEEELGAFTQYPLRLAWAITIHKSQGLTFEKAVIDAGAAFAPGQVYVALSRCTNMQNMVLLSRITNSSLHTDERIIRFAQRKLVSEEALDTLQKAKHAYQTSILLQLFSVKTALKTAADCFEFVTEHAASFNEETLPYVQTMVGQLENLQKVADKFKTQIEQLAQQTTLLPEHNDALQQRVIAGVNYFTEQLGKLIQQLHQSPAITDSRGQAGTYSDCIKDLYAALYLQNHLIKACSYGLNVAAYQQEKLSFVLPYFTVSAYAKAAAYKDENVPNPPLYKLLRQLRDDLADKNNVPIYLIVGTASLTEMAQYLPANAQELANITGFGKVKIQQYGDAFLQIITAYCKENGLASLMDQKEPKKQAKEPKPPAEIKHPKEKKPATAQETLRLYQEGKSIAEIAELRNLALSTIEGHLTQFIRVGEMDVALFVTKEKMAQIFALIPSIDPLSASLLKQALGDDFSYTEVKAAIAHWQFLHPAVDL